MNYKVLIKKCEDPQRASVIAAEVARWSGSTPEVVYNNIIQRAISIRKDADEEEARRLQALFGGIGAEVELVPIHDGAAVAAPPVVAAGGVAAAAGVAAGQQRMADDDDDDEPEGRLLSEAEYIEMCKVRKDIFHVETDSHTRNIELVCMLLAIGAGWFMSTREPVAIVEDFFERLPEERSASFKQIDATLEEKKEEEKKEKEKVPTEQKKLKETKSTGVSAQQGGGDPRARVTKKGVLGIVSGEIKGRAVLDADVMAKGGFARDIDAMLQGVGGLKSGGDGGVGRKGVAGMGTGTGYGSGHGGGAGGVDDLLGNLMGGGGGNLNLQKRGELAVRQPSGFQAGGSLTGGRTRPSITRVVTQNLPALRHAYNRRLAVKPGLKGMITVKFAIDEFGTVMWAQLVNSTMNDSDLETTVVNRVKSWNFGKIDKPGDVTEVVYPFAFSE